ncbi:MAG: secretin N-terminal domain-containing protein [Gemmataceae bacterium]
MLRSFITINVFFITTMHAVAEPVPVANKERGYKFLLPEGFERDPSVNETEIASPTTKATLIWVFRRATANGEITVSVLEYSHLMRKDEIGDLKKVQGEYPSGTILLRKWKQAELKVIRNVETDAGGTIVTYMCPLPLDPSAIMVLVRGAPKDEDDIDNTAKRIFETLEGQERWDSPKARGILDMLLDQRPSCCHGVVLIGIVYLITRWVRRKRKPMLAIPVSRGKDSGRNSSSPDTSQSESAPKPSDVRLEVIQVEHMLATELCAVLDRVFKGTATITPEPQTNSLIIRASEGTLEEMKALMKKLDKGTTQ